MEQGYIIARPYAKAIFEVALAAKKLSQWSKILNVLTLIAKNPKTTEFLTDPRSSWQQHADLFINVCGKILDDNGKNFINILSLNQRLNTLPDIAELYEKLHAAQEKIIKATVISTIKLNTKQQQNLQRALQKWLQRVGANNYSPILQYQQNESIIGGLIIRIGDRVIDGSVRGKLEKLRAELWH